MSVVTLLLAEDESNIVELIRYHAEQQGYRVLAAADGKRAVEIALREKPSVILLDLMLPEISGLDVCKLLKQNYKTQDIPILMVTAKAEEADVVLGLELGADDYITKPFSPRQLMARIKAVLRRNRPAASDRVIRAGELELDTAKHVVTLGGRRIELTSKEFGTLLFLMESHGRALSREAILSGVWGDDASLELETRAVDKHIAELRKKLKSEGSRIVTIKNFGYRFEIET